MRLWQYRAGDNAQIVRQPGEGTEVNSREGIDSARLLFADHGERVLLEKWNPDADVTVQNEHGLEFLVVSGTFTSAGETLEPQSWGRLPAGHALKAQVGPDGARVWLKEAPLQHPDILAMPE